MTLTLKPQTDTRPEQEFFYVFDGEQNLVGRIFNGADTAARGVTTTWFWGLSFPFYRGSDAPHYGNAISKDAAMAAFKARWLLSHPE